MTKLTERPCDARIEGVRLGEPTRSPVSQGPTISHSPVAFVRPPVDTVGSRNFCGESIAEASANCTQARHCPMGNNNECPEGMYCFQNVESCNIYDMPTMRPTISPKPTPYPTIAPSTANPANTMSPTMSPLDADDIRNFFFCGTSWGDASQRW